MSLPPDGLRFRPQDMPRDPCPLCGRGGFRPGRRCCKIAFKYLRYPISENDKARRTMWAEALKTIIEGPAS